MKAGKTAACGSIPSEVVKSCHWLQSLIHQTKLSSQYMFSLLQYQGISNHSPSLAMSKYVFIVVNNIYGYYLTGMNEILMLNDK